MAALAFAAVLSGPDSDAESVANHSVTAADGTETKTGGELEFTISFTESAGDPSAISYEAKLTNSSGTTQSNAVSPSSGDLSNGGSATLKVTAPTTAGRYTLTVTWTETLDGESTTYTDSVRIGVHEPITLSMTLENTGSVGINTNVYFYVDGTMIDGSSTSLSIAPGESQTLTYGYYDSDLSSGKHTFYVASADGSTVLSGEKTFYYNQDDSNWESYLMALIVIILIIVFIWIYRKPVKNYGKPKARR